jgi:glucose-1-phosphate adenylyltransferase
VTVHSFAEVGDSILLEGVDVGRNTKIKRAIVDKEVQIPPGTEIGYDLEEDAKRFTVTASGIVVVPKGIRL